MNLRSVFVSLLHFRSSRRFPFPAHAQDWRTPTEISDYRTTPDYAETVAYLERVAAAAPGPGEDREFRQDRRGARSEDRDRLEGWRLRSGGDSCVGRAILLVQNAIHAGEMDGKDSCLALLRDMVITKIQGGAA